MPFAQIATLRAGVLPPTPTWFPVWEPGPPQSSKLATLSAGTATALTSAPAAPASLDTSTSEEALAPGQETMPYDALHGDAADPMAENRQLADEDERQEHLRRQAAQAANDPDWAAGRTFNDLLHNEFEQHATRLRARARDRRESVQLKAAVLDKEEREDQNIESTLGRKQPQDEFQVRGAVHPIYPAHLYPVADACALPCLYTGRHQYAHDSGALKTHRPER